MFHFMRVPFSLNCIILVELCQKNLNNLNLKYENNCGLEMIIVEKEMEQFAVYYTSPQSFLISRLNNFGDF